MTTATSSSELYRAAYREIGRLTPIAADCGRLCNARCCRGGGEWGMLLFPDEQSGFKIHTLDLRGTQCRQALCSGRCVRALRPLSCRIYPLAPYLEGGELRIIFDPRAARCPLNHSRESIQPEFWQAVRRAFEILRAIDGMDEFLTVYSSVLDDYLRFG